MAGSYEHSNEILGSIKCGELLDWLRNFDAQEGLCPMELVSHSASVLVSYFVN